MPTKKIASRTRRTKSRSPVPKKRISAAKKMIKVKVFRFDPAVGRKPSYKTYQVPFEEGMSAMGALDYIYQHEDGTIAYYDHAGCSLGICGRCTARINGKPGLLCQTPVKGDLTLEPLNQKKVLKDLVMEAAPASEAKEQAGEPERPAITDINAVPLLIRREIEALIAAPIIKAFVEEFGKEKTLEVAGRVIKALARQMGQRLATMTGGNTLEHFAKAAAIFGQGPDYEETIEATPRKLSTNVFRCKYAEMYRRHGLEDVGYLLSCGRDFALMEGFNPRIKLTRTQTVMEGAPFCDMRWTYEEEE
ncbi:MAG TPA: L-2-amino-thiazoline-4-carboxylic acid hydrolase [Syntrophorhabdales bacterium]|nr:L-2-amino-thiazoline-4-carboxylic acid hydrolase [Syntrophorhabdales bacterium]